MLHCNILMCLMIAIFRNLIVVYQHNFAKRKPHLNNDIWKENWCTFLKPKLQPTKFCIHSMVCLSWMTFFCASCTIASCWCNLVHYFWLRTNQMVCHCTIIYFLWINFNFTLQPGFSFLALVFVWRRCRVHVKCTVWTWSLSLGENILTMPL